MTTNLRLGFDAIVARLDELGGGPDSAVCFDADGTLWSGDVGEDAFRFGLDKRLFREPALKALQQMALDNRLPAASEVNEQAAILYRGFVEGSLPEREACEMMAVAFAGWSEAELSPILSDALHQAELASRLFKPLEKVFTWARSTATPTFIISASPDFVVHIAAQHWDVPAEQIAACTPARSNNVVTSQLAFGVPYEDSKVTAGQQLLAGRRWLASFGDSGFDRAMLEASELGVAVRPKPALLYWLRLRPNLCVLDGW